MKRVAIGLVVIVALLGSGALGYGLAQIGGDGGGDESTATSMTATEAESIAVVDGWKSMEMRFRDVFREGGFALTCRSTERANDVLSNRDPEGAATPPKVNGPGWLVVCSMRRGTDGSEVPQWRTVFVTDAGEVLQLP